MLSVVVWKWGRSPFDAGHVNRMRSMLARHLHLPHQLWCITDDLTGIDPRVECLQLPEEFANTPRCRRRMWQYSRQRKGLFGDRMLCLDLDLVLVDNITPLVDRPEPLVMLRIAYANVLAAGFVLCDTGSLHGAYEAYRANPQGYPASTHVPNASDLAMLNHHLRGRQIAEWAEADGFVIYFGQGYERHEHLGIGPNRQQLPVGTRVVVLGSADLPGLAQKPASWLQEHWR